jgi:hypothetical protein
MGKKKSNLLFTNRFQGLSHVFSHVLSQLGHLLGHLLFHFDLQISNSFLHFCFRYCSTASLIVLFGNTLFKEEEENEY